jgi:hypothetical protein
MMSNVSGVCCLCSEEEDDRIVNEEDLWKCEVGWIVIKTWRLHRITRKINFSGEPIKLKAYNDGKLNFDRVELEFIDGETMNKSGLPASDVLKRTEAFFMFTKIEMTAYTNDGRSEGKVFWVDSQMCVKPVIQLTYLKKLHYSEVDYVLIKFKDPIENTDDEEDVEEKDDGETYEVEGVGPKKKRKLE